MTDDFRECVDMAVDDMLDYRTPNPESDMPDRVTLKCQSCKASIFFAKSATTGRLMPINADPAEDGNIVVLDGVAHTKNGDLFEEMVPDDLPRYKSHFATCPSAAKHRKAKN